MKRPKLDEVAAGMKAGERKFFQSDKGPAYIKKGQADPSKSLFNSYEPPKKKAKVITSLGYESYSRGKLID